MYTHESSKPRVHLGNIAVEAVSCEQRKKCFPPLSLCLLLLRSVSCVRNAEMKRRSPAKSPLPPLPSTHKQPSNNKEEEDELILQVLKPTGWLVELIAFNLEAISSVFLALLSMVCEPLHRAKEVKESAEAAAKAVPAYIARGGGVVLRRLELGILGASHVFLVLVLVLVLAAFAGVGLVRWWAEEPVLLREPLHFDYTEVHPSAAVGIGHGGGGGGGRKMKVLPVGHTLHVTVLLLMPESDYNRRIGVFQLTAEAISATGSILAKSSQPCMLRFRSLPVRLIRTLVMAVPLLLGITCETQEVHLPILSYKEGYPRTRTIKVHLKAKASSPAGVPELYSAQLLLNSHLPWSKALVYRWKWTLCVWASIYIYISFLIALLCFARPVVFPTIGGGGEHDDEIVEVEQQQVPGGSKGLQRDGGEARRRYSDALRRWRERRGKRKALLRSRCSRDPGEGSPAASTSSTLVTREETGEDSNEYDSSELGAQESEISST